MKRIEKVIITIIFIIIILLVIIIFMFKNNIFGNNLFNNENIQESEKDDEYEDSIQISDYFAIKSGIQGYIDSLDKTNDIYYVTEESGERKYNPNIQKQVLYSFLSSSYIKNNNISESNIDQYIKPTNEKCRYYPLEIKVLKKGDISAYKVSGIIQNLDYKNAIKMYFAVNIDYSNSTFSIQQLEEKEYINYNNTNDSEDSIKNNEYNVFSKTSFDVQTVSLEYFEMYKFFTIANPEITYNMMTEDYRNKRFGSLENYIQYIKDTHADFIGINATKYSTKNTDKTIQYVVQDQYGNNYIFDTKSMTDYTVKFDTYTIEDEDYISNYNKEEENSKVQINIGKFFNMINSKDYKSAYKLLDENFKKNNFPSMDKLKEYVENNLYSYSKVDKVLEMKKYGNYYITVLNVINGENDIIQAKKVTVVMELKEGTDFVMSFSMD